MTWKGVVRSDSGLCWGMIQAFMHKTLSNENWSQGQDLNPDLPKSRGATHMTTTIRPDDISGSDCLEPLTFCMKGQRLLKLRVPPKSTLHVLHNLRILISLVFPLLASFQRIRPRSWVTSRNNFFTIMSCYTHAQPLSWRTTPCRLFATANSILWRIDPLGKHVSAATNTHATAEVLLETGCFFMIHAEML
jgi:hypothetical protein